MSVDNSSIRLEEFTLLSLCQPYGFSFQLDIKLGLAIFALIDDDLVVQVDLLHRFSGLSYRKLYIYRRDHILMSAKPTATF